MIATGPLGGHAVETGLVIAGTDAVAADVVGGKLLGFGPQAVRHLWEAQRLGLGEADPEQMQFPALSMKQAIERFTEAARANGIEPAVRRFPEGTKTAEDAARAIGCEVGQIVKSLVFTAGGRPVIALVSGANRLDPGRLAVLTGGETGKADAETVREATGYSIGGVPPFGHTRELRVFMDRDLERYPVVWAAAGRPDSVFAIAPDRLARLSRATVAELG
jgi:prolyl-tRNA editing enzyme YbaK/EbsC (Cys-tRNA(Pro) deacylase)